MPMKIKVFHGLNLLVGAVMRQIRRFLDKKNLFFTFLFCSYCVVVN